MIGAVSDGAAGAIVDPAAAAASAEEALWTTAANIPELFEAQPEVSEQRSEVRGQKTERDYRAESGKLKTVMLTS